MLIKDRDSHEGAVEQLRGLLSLNLSPRKKFLIERELKSLCPGEDGGKNASHLINFYCTDSPDWAVIHDLKIENNGFSTHIDHILIDRFLDIYVFESKNYTYSLKITADGEFLIFDGRHYQPVESPLEENETRIKVLKKVLRENKIFPRRMGIPRRPKIKSFVLLSHRSNVLRPPASICDTSSIVTADYLTEKMLRQAERIKRIYVSLKSLPKAFKPDTLKRVASKLASVNQPGSVDYHQVFAPQDACEDITSGGCTPPDAAAYCDYAI